MRISNVNFFSNVIYEKKFCICQFINSGIPCIFKVIFKIILYTFFVLRRLLYSHLLTFTSALKFALSVYKKHERIKEGILEVANYFFLLFKNITAIIS